MSPSYLLFTYSFDHCTERPVFRMSQTDADLLLGREQVDGVTDRHPSHELQPRGQHREKTRT